MPERSRVSGEAANLDIRSQIFPDILQIPVNILRGKEFEALRAAMTIGIATGIFKDFKEAVDKMVKITKTVYPRKDTGNIRKCK